ncbi:MAG: PAS domain-containing protein [Planctomycetia bacterium]|nr:PAS domain-containing protein [Planctomycetia bacterium]
MSSAREILLIEDNEADRVLISVMLADQVAERWQTTTASTLAEGLQLLNEAIPQSESRFAAVLLDLSLPDSHGFETFVAVHQLAPWLPVVVLTGNADEGIALQAVHSGAQDYLSKNALTSDLLLKSLRYAIKRKQLEREWREELEQRVRERTAELSVANEGLLREIAERRRAEEALQDSQRFVERITNATPSIVYVLDVVGRKTLYANERLQSVLGYSLADLSGFDSEALKQLVHPDDLDRCRESFMRTLSLSDDEVLENEARVQHADGSWRWLQTRKVVFRRATDGTVRLILGSAFDITDRKQAEEQSRQQQEQLVYVSRLTMLGELASGLAHELNQPLMAVTNYAQASLRRVRSGEFDPDELLSWLEKTSQQALLAGEIIKRLRRLVSRRPPEQSATDINEAIREVFEMIRPEADGREVRVNLALVDSLPQVPADRIQLQQVLLNLIRNGLDAMQQTPADERSLTIESTLAENNFVSVAITDHGEGCDAKKLRRIFEPFYTTKEQGLGMGLSISRSIIESHGGRLIAQPNLTRGLTFRFTLPLPAGVAG